MPKFSEKSRLALATAVPELQTLFNEVIKYRDCVVLEGHRSKEAQDLAYENGKSRVRWPHGMHNRKPSLAVDVVPYPVDWNNTARFDEFGGFVLGVATMMGIPVRWGGHWSNFVDRPHYELIPAVEIPVKRG